MLNPLGAACHLPPATCLQLATSPSQFTRSRNLWHAKLSHGGQAN